MKLELDKEMSRQLRAFLKATEYTIETHALLNLVFDIPVQDVKNIMEGEPEDIISLDLKPRSWYVV